MALPASDPERSNAIAERLTTNVANVAGAWKTETAAERNKLAREMFNGVVIDNRTAVAVMPRPDLHAFSRRWRSRRQAS